MKRRQRKFIGAVVMVVFVALYALLVTAAIPRVILDFPPVGQMIFYAVAGLAWTLPLLPLIRWMEQRSQGDD